MSNANVSSKRDTKSLNYVIRSGIAGGFAGCVAKTVVAPLDRVKILFQASNPEFQKYSGTWSGAFRAGSQIYKENGIKGLLQGHSVTLLRVFPYAAIKFMAYDQVQHILMPTKEHETNFRRFSAGAMAGMTSVFFTYPLELIRVRMAFQTRHSDAHSANVRPLLTRVVTQIYQEGSALSSSQRTHIFNRIPILKFYRGFTATMAGMIPYAGVSFLCWGYLRARFLHGPKGDHIKPKPLYDLAIGAVSGATAQTVSYPFEVIRRRMQVGGLTRPGSWLGWRETVRTIWRTSGAKGFYVGLSIGYLKVVPMNAVSFTVWVGMKRFFDV